ncbi:hypothetical protein Y032_0339g2962 [Ancylostoma ceylanicum]|uniref:Uncharacterized protein n=1 Tax=Ancylostoma ceylanicum TaxID=53326 RepID=A0A016RY76_9BILA|nr:hypothetical protein Y032_0339g2962 [Ancylostoma ceylanicum]
MHKPGEPSGAVAAWISSTFLCRNCAHCGREGIIELFCRLVTGFGRSNKGSSKGLHRKVMRSMWVVLL